MVGTTEGVHEVADGTVVLGALYQSNEEEVVGFTAIQT